MGYLANLTVQCPAAVIPFGTASKEQDPHPVKVDDPHQADCKFRCLLQSGKKK